MIDTSHLDRIRVVTPGKGNSGTEIESDLSKVDAHDADSLKPIRGALGAGFSDSIFTSGKSLLTEGYTDRVYISSMAHILNRRDSESLPSGCGILDMGSDGKWNKYTRFLDSEGFEYHLLLDSDKAKNNSIDKIEKSEHISREQVTFIDDVISEVEGNTTIESLMGQELLTKILHELYGLNMENIDINESKPKPIVDQAEEVVSGEHNQGNDAFKKPEIAEYFCEKIKERPEEFPTDVCLERF
ncbi:MAG: TOPRIM nucleotidyl transferase/hydrolase domain-containing protein, partial [Candidatus Paceibacteria bacterium]